MEITGMGADGTPTRYIDQASEDIFLKTVYENLKMNLVSSSTIFTFSSSKSSESLRHGESSVKIVEDDTRFIFKFETDGSLKAIDVLNYALKRIPQRLNVLLDSMAAAD